MNADQAIAYQRHVFLAQQSNTKSRGELLENGIWNGEKAFPLS